MFTLVLLIFIFVVPTLFAWAIFSGTKAFSEKTMTAAASLVSGLAVFTTLIYALTIVGPLSLTMISLTLALLAVITVIVCASLPVLANWRQERVDWLAVGIWVLLLGLFLIIGPKLLIAQPDGLYTGIVNAYGDVAWHMSNITLLADRAPVPPVDPIFANTRLTYPFMSNFFSSILLKSGASFTQVFDIPAIVLIPAFLVLLYSLVRELGAFSEITKPLAKKAALIALILFLFGGATWGFYRIAGDYTASGQSLAQFLTHLPMRDYSGVGTDEQGFHFLNPVTTLLLPQRAFLFGLPLALIIVLLLLRSGKDDIAPLMMAGVLSGILPMFHAHTIVALVPIILTLVALQRGHHWWIYFLTAGIVGFPEIMYFASGSAESGSFLRFDPGWMKPDSDSFIWYWFKNTGFFFPAIFLGLYIPLSKHLKALALAAATLFAIANIFLLAPWAWDNFKIIVYWFLFSLPLVSYALAYYLRRPVHHFIWVLPLTFIILQSTSAALDVWKLTLPTAQIWNEWDTSGMAFAEQVAQVTKPGETILTAPIHNTPIVLAGRPLYLGFAAHVWSHGGLPWNREAAIGPFYQGLTTELPEATPTYVVIGPVEREKFSPIVIRPNWQLVTQNADYQLYKITN